MYIQGVHKYRIHTCNNNNRILSGKTLNWMGVFNYVASSVVVKCNLWFNSEVTNFHILLKILKP